MNTQNKCHWTRYADFCTESANKWQVSLDDKSVPKRWIGEISERVDHLRAEATEAEGFAELSAFDIATRIQQRSMEVV